MEKKKKNGTTFIPGKIKYEAEKITKVLRKKLSFKSATKGTEMNSNRRKTIKNQYK